MGHDLTELDTIQNSINAEPVPYNLGIITETISFYDMLLIRQPTRQADGGIQRTAYWSSRQKVVPTTFTGTFKKKMRASTNKDNLTMSIKGQVFYFQIFFFRFQIFFHSLDTADAQKTEWLWF